NLKKDLFCRYLIQNDRFIGKISNICKFSYKFDRLLAY
ncbi:hypothetical protein MHA_2208, partial [Mannheimia haemolytica PHL213]